MACISFLSFSRGISNKVDKLVSLQVLFLFLLEEQLVCFFFWGGVVVAFDCIVNRDRCLYYYTQF